MPYEVLTDAEGCDGFAVVKVGEPDEVLGCHETADDAEEQVAALYAAESEDSADEEGPEEEEAESEPEARMEIRTAAITAGTEGRSFSGYAAVWDSPSLKLPFVERISSGAFARTLKSRNNIQLLHAHNPELILGSTRAKTLRLEEDGKGLKVSADLPDTSWGRDVAELVRRGDLAHMSFGFSVPRGGDEWSEDGKNRTLNEVRLHEVSTVGAPAYTQTVATVRAVDCPQCVSDPDGWVCLLERFANREELTADEARSIAEAAQELTAEEPRGLPAALARLMLGHYARGASRGNPEVSHS